MWTAGSSPAAVKSRAQWSCASWSKSAGSFRAGLIDGGVKALGRKFPAPHDQLPGPFDRFLLEVIAEAPVAEHLEKGVVIGVEADVVEVVVLAAGADAFLRVGGARRIEGRALLPRKMGTNWFMPALVKSRFGASGRSDDEGTMVCCFSRKKSRNDWRISAEVIGWSLAWIAEFSCRGARRLARSTGSRIRRKTSRGQSRAPARVPGARRASRLSQERNVYGFFSSSSFALTAVSISS